ncbi:MAG: class I SAM-dependent methyltransferase [Patescibacteria group bacterium]
MNKKTEDGDGKEIQGKNPENIFSKLYPLVYASISSVIGAYEKLAETIAVLADANLPDGLRGKTVLDIGCGFGTTALAVSAYAPRKIIAVDNSAGMIELLKTVYLTKKDLKRWIFRQRGAQKVLGRFYDPTLRHLLFVREVFQKGIFARRGGELQVINADGLEVDRFVLEQVDAIIGSNYLHWPVNKMLSAGLSLQEACDNALRPLAGVLRPGGVMVLMEGEDFIIFDDDPEEEADFLGNVAVEHPVFVKFHAILNDILKKEHGIQRSMPKRSVLFPRSKLADLFSRYGLKLKRFHHMESAKCANPLDVNVVSFLQLMGGINLPFEKKMELGKKVYKKLSLTITKKERMKPLRSQIFFQVLEKGS